MVRKDSDTRITPHNFTPFSSVSIVDFEQLDGVQTSYTLNLFFTCRYNVYHVTNMIEKLELNLLKVLFSLKIKFWHAQN